MQKGREIKPLGWFDSSCGQGLSVEGSGCQELGVHQGCGFLGSADLSSLVCSPTSCQGLCHLVGVPQSFWAAAHDGRGCSFWYLGSPTSDRDVWLVGNQRGSHSHPGVERLHPFPGLCPQLTSPTKDVSKEDN